MQGGDVRLSTTVNTEGDELKSLHLNFHPILKSNRALIWALPFLPAPHLCRRGWGVMLRPIFRQQDAQKTLTQYQVGSMGIQHPHTIPYQWYLGYVKEVKDDSVFIDHLERVDEESHLQWRYPRSEDVHRVEIGQVLEIEVNGEWDNESDRTPKFKLNNHRDIKECFSSFQINWNCFIHGDLIWFLDIWKKYFIRYWWFCKFEPPWKTFLWILECLFYLFGT